MVLDRKQTTIAYRCPECGAIVKGAVGIFTLTADMIKLKCPCGNSALEIIYTRDKKVRLNVPCFVCPTPHSYLISSNVFFERDIFTLGCAYSGLDICFIGNEESIDKAVAESEAELIEIAGEDAIKALAESRGTENDIPDVQVLDIIRYIVSELAEEGNIHCNCDGAGEYELEFGEGSVYVVCTKCRAELEIPSGSVDRAYAFLNADEITLK